MEPFALRLSPSWNVASLIVRSRHVGSGLLRAIMSFLSPRLFSAQMAASQRKLTFSTAGSVSRLPPCLETERDRGPSRQAGYLYARVSTKRQADNDLSVPDQIAYGE